jgi:hypothetical protein
MAETVNGAWAAKIPAPDSLRKFLRLWFMVYEGVCLVVSDKLEKNPHCDLK